MQSNSKFTKEQAIIISGFTGKLACNFSEFHGDVEKRIGRPVFTHEFGSNQFSKQVEEMYRKDFLSMVEVTN